MSRLPRLLMMTVLPLAFARGAGAVEREHQLGVDIGLPMLTIANPGSSSSPGTTTPDIGAAFGIHYGYGITDQFNLLAELQYSLLAFNFPMGEPATHPAEMWNCDIGVTYVLDVLRWVPYFGGLAGGYLMNGGTLTGALLLPGAEIVVGLDYLVTPKWAVGVELSEHFLFTDMTLYTSYSTAFARTEFRWGK